MDEQQRIRMLWAGALIVAGTVLLLFNLGVMAAYEPAAQFVIAGVFALGGLGFLIAAWRRRDQWWRVMPGWTLLALAGMVLLTTRPDVPSPLMATLLFVGLAFAFAHVYLLDRGGHWWAIIPGGFMGVLAVVIGLSVITSRLETLGAALFVGMGLVFGLVYLLGGQRHWWALIPGAVLLTFGMVLYTVDEPVSDNAFMAFVWRWWPALLIVLGLALIYWIATAVPRGPSLSVNVAPKVSPPDAPDAGRLGEYSRPAPGASVDILPDPDDRR